MIWYDAKPHPSSSSFLGYLTLLFWFSFSESEANKHYIVSRKRRRTVLLLPCLHHLLSSSSCSTPWNLKPSILRRLPFLTTMKDRPPPSSYGNNVYVPPHQRLRSVVVDSKLRQTQPTLLNPTPSEQVPHKLNSRFVSAYDDAVSEEGSDREFEPASLPVRLFT